MAEELFFLRKGFKRLLMVVDAKLLVVARRLKGDGEAVELEVDEVALGVAGLAAGGDVGAAALLDGDGDCWK
jgi:hypothetical protein